MLENFCSPTIVRFHERMISSPEALPDAGPAGPARLWRWIAVNHRCNSLLWDEEDKARRRDVGDEHIAAGKRLIDRYNQQRNDAVEAMDEILLAALAPAPAAGARLHSETLGAMIDRLSILALKIHHMRAEAERREADPEHIARCAGKLGRLLAQRHDLAACFDHLLAEIGHGRAYFKLYRQFKMYNDPALNPWLRDSPRSAQGAGGGA